MPNSGLREPDEHEIRSTPPLSPLDTGTAQCNRACAQHDSRPRFGHARFVRSLTRPRSADAGTPRRAGWRDRLFGRAGEEHFQRRTSDWIRLGTGIVILVIASRHAGDVTATERAIVDLVHTLP